MISTLHGSKTDKLLEGTLEKKEEHTAEVCACASGEEEFGGLASLVINLQSSFMPSFDFSVYECRESHPTRGRAHWSPSVPWDFSDPIDLLVLKPKNY